MPTRYVDNGDNTFTLIRDDGYRQPFMDPDGSLRRELDAMANSSTNEIDPMAVTARSPVAATPTYEPPAPPKPRGYIPPPGAAPPPNIPGAEYGAILDAAPGVPAAGNPVVDPSAQPAAPSTIRLEIPGTPGESKTTKDSSWQSTTTTGESRHDKDPDGTIKAAGEAAIGAQREANVAGTDARRKQLANTTQLYDETKARVTGELDAFREDEAKHKGARDKALADRETLRNTPISLEDAISDGEMAAAMGATIGAAIANVGLAWMGQQARPVTIIDDLIARRTKQLGDQRKDQLQGMTERADLSAAELAEAKANIRVAVAQQLELQRAGVDNENELIAIDALVKDNEAKLKQAELEYATAVADEVTKTSNTVKTSGGGTSTTVGSGTPGFTIELPAGSDEEVAADAVNAMKFDQGASDGDKKALEKLKENVYYLDDRERTIQELEQLEKKSGAISDVIGLAQARGGAVLNVVGLAKYARSPEQNRAADLLAKLESLNRFDWKTEPNSVKTQERMSQLGLPANDRDLAMFLKSQKDLIRQGKASNYDGYADPVVGKFRTLHRKSSPAGDLEPF